MKIGDMVMEVPMLLTLEVEQGKQHYTPLPGKVIFIHPEQRFYTVEFYFKNNFVRESFFFSPEDREEGRDYACYRYYECQRRRRENRYNRQHGGTACPAV